jgi:ATP-dependent Lon protease
VNNLYATVDVQERELQVLRSEAASLQQEIRILEDQVRSGEEQASELTNQISLAKRVQVKHYGLAVNQNNAGVVFPIEVEIIGAGDGRISVDVGNVQYEASFQTAVRTAAAVASEYTGVPSDDKDIIVKLINDDNDIIKVDGPSAGALITAMIIAGLIDQEIRPSVLITGAIEPDGKIGAVGSIPAKTSAAVDFGATAMLVPKSQEFQHEDIGVFGVSDITEVVDQMIKP